MNQKCNREFRPKIKDPGNDLKYQRMRSFPFAEIIKCVLHLQLRSKENGITFPLNLQKCECYKLQSTQIKTIRLNERK